ncbi:MAG: HAMP domain-containing histidine kinase [Methylococcaceae bacterium]|nr:HAMP domain-containing histidine kinase [Methylococcaceae bacterium]
MSVNTTLTIFPCPLSKGYGIPAKQAWLLLKVFLAYRVVLGSLFVILFYVRLSPSLIGSYNKDLFIISSQIYLAISILSGFSIVGRHTGYTVQAHLLILTDILILTLLMHACGGINSGMGILLAVSIASGGLLIGGRCAMFIAALGSLAVLAEQIYADYTHSFVTTSYAYAGMLGASFFTIAFLSYILAQRSEQILQLADRQQQTIANLEELSQYIIQHMRSGIIIVNRDQSVQMANEASLRLVNLAVMPGLLSDISSQLSRAFQTWLGDAEQNLALLQLPNQSDIHIRFMVLPTRHDFFYMVILEDITLYNQRLQQSKLASLGQLTASIAHEIRNPLGAISHAGQLLSEIPNLSSLDQRLIEIIQTHCNRVNHIIEDILQLSKRSNSTREKILLKSWLEKYLFSFNLEHAVSSGIFKLVPESDSLSAFIDSSHLKQIMDNLCQNALKYGRPELGPILLQLLINQRDVCIEVIDNGAVISQEDMQHLFEPFFTTSVSGTGLGLYISKELAELNQAKLSYHLTTDNRSCFRLRLQNAEHAIIDI